MCTALCDGSLTIRSSFHRGLLAAIDVYPAFATTGDTSTRKREASAFLANVAHETGQLVYVEEIAKGEYCDNSPWFCPCAPGKRYFGRGPIQLSWNYNYCAASESIFGDREVLRTDPDRVAREPWLAWATALWFWSVRWQPARLLNARHSPGESFCARASKTIASALRIPWGKLER